jgi:TonB family protein
MFVIPQRRSLSFRSAAEESAFPPQRKFGMNTRICRYPTPLLAAVLAVCALTSPGHTQPPAAVPQSPPYDTAPELIRQGPDPSVHLELLAYSAEAQPSFDPGTLIVTTIVDLQGRPQDVHLLRGIGMGRDVKAIVAVKQTQFKPAMKDGIPVRTPVNIKVTFVPTN